MVVKEKFDMEFVLNASPKLLFGYLSTPSGLGEWFADDVDAHNAYYTFSWDGSVENAELLEESHEKFVRFQWESDEGTDCYWELRIQLDELTNDVSLIVTDFCEQDELEASKLFWQGRVDGLKRIIGA